MGNPSAHVTITCPEWAQDIAQAWLDAEGLDGWYHEIEQCEVDGARLIVVCDPEASWGESELSEWLSDSGIAHDVEVGSAESSEIEEGSQYVRPSLEGARVVQHRLGMGNAEGADMLQRLFRTRADEGAQRAAALLESLYEEHGGMMRVESIEDVARRGPSPYAERAMPEMARRLRAGEGRPDQELLGALAREAELGSSGGVAQTPPQARRASREPSGPGL